jgi:hypothetical protein
MGQVVTLKDVYLQPTMIVMFEGGKQLPNDVMKHLNERYEKVINKLGVQTD